MDSPVGNVVTVDIMVAALVVVGGAGWTVNVCPFVVMVCSPVKIEPSGSVRNIEEPSGSVKVSTFEDNLDAVEDTLDVVGIGSTVNVEPDVVSVSIPVIEALAGTVRVIIGPLGSVSVSTMKEDSKTLDTGVIGSIVNVELDIVRVSSPLTEELAGTVRVRIGPLGSVSVSTIEEATDMLDAVGIGSTVNVELDIVRVSSPLIEALAGNLRVMKDPPGCESVSRIKDVELLDATGIGSTVNVEDIVRVSSPVIELLAESVTRDPPGSVSVSKIKDADVVGVRELEAVERATVFDIDSPSGPSELVEVDDCGETDELRLPLIILEEVKTDSELELAVLLAELLYGDAEDEVVVTVVQDEELPVGVYWRTSGTKGLENEVPIRAARLDRLMICFNAISAERLR
jgi:hypothetical protein